jgi:hypothetical protein
MEELCVRIRSTMEPEEVLELLDITVEELLDHFDYRLDEHWDRLQEELGDE